MSLQTEAILDRNISNLLSKVKTIVDHQNEVSKLRGENFNVFTILKMETKENATHSAFLVELLNPKGTHLMEDVFLQLFLTEIGYDGELVNPKVKAEHTIGKVDLKNKTGGRIDLFIWDDTGKIISIENKIHAGEQEAQIPRYLNYQKDNNTVYYLTLNGDESQEAINDNLTKDKDYYCISYADTIKEWLLNCLKESAESPILRETIKQYILLINKLTSQLPEELMKAELETLIGANYISAKTIHKALEEAEYNICRSFVIALTHYIEKSLGNNWDVKIQENLNKPYHGIHIRNDNWDSNVYIKVEADSRLLENQAYYGVVANKAVVDRQKLNDLLSNVIELSDWRNTNGWPCYQTIFNLGSTETREKLFDNNQFEQLVSNHSKTIEDFAVMMEPILMDVKPKNKEA